MPSPANPEENQAVPKPAGGAMPTAGAVVSGGERFNPVSPKLVRARLILWLPVPVLIAIAGIVLALLLHWSFWFLAAAGIALAAWAAWLVPAQVRRIGWLEAPDELLITRGRLWHTFTVVPYGRIQYVDVQAGPIDQAFGLQTITLNTASTSSDSTVPGLPAAEATALRRRLSEQARERMSGL